MGCSSAFFGVDAPRSSCERAGEDGAWTAARRAKLGAHTPSRCRLRRALRAVNRCPAANAPAITALAKCGA
ncbi:MAG: hypothetical protein U0269_26385 [Polyangiales bacterium]